MAVFTNYATLSFNGGSAVSNTVTGELLETLAVTKTAVVEEYSAGSQVTYVVSLVNSGSLALTGLTVTDDLGGYAFGTGTVYPLTYADGSVRYYVNGILQAAPAAAGGPPLVISGISVPAGGNATVIYEARANAYAPLAADGQILNTVSVTGGGLTTAVTAQETVTASQGPELGISKSVSPTVVTENGQLTYTFVIENRGNTEAVTTDNVVLTDVFDPILTISAVTYNGTAWVQGTNYTYDAATGTFASLPGQITVAAATYTQNTDGTFTVTPGVAVVTVTGTV